MTVCKPYIVFLANLALISLLFGCARTTTATTKPEDLAQIKTIIVLPVEIGPNSQGSRSAKEMQQLEKGQKLLDALLAEYFSNSEGVTLLTPGQRDELEENMRRCRTSAVVAMCQTKKADAVLLYTLQRFTEREGTEYSIVNPASVAFNYKLVQSETNQTLCSGTFDETQQPLLDNIYQFFKKAKRGIKWLSAEELAREGLKLEIADCPYLKK